MRHVLDSSSALAVVTLLFLSHSPAVFGDSRSESLVQRVARGDRDAILEAGNTGDKGFIPVLESTARPHYTGGPESIKGLSPQQAEALSNSVWRTVYDDPVAVNARMALAKLGMKDYLDEILLELTDPASSPVCKEREGHPQYGCYPIDLRNAAFHKLAYIKNRSTVRAIASFLSVTSEPDSTGSDVKYEPYAHLAMRTLAQIVDDPPQINLPDDSENFDARSKIWQQWWEQNKDKYP
ncbi:MAG: hypothetical protein ABSA12_11230 [Verrucomicrobiia bacterium]|jgi:hypothetical protein